MCTRRACTADGIGLTGIGDLSERLTKTILQSTNVAYDRFGSSASHRCALVVRYASNTTELMRRTEASRCANSGRSASQQNAIPTVEATFIADGGRPCRGENQRTHRQILATAR